MKNNPTEKEASLNFFATESLSGEIVNENAPWDFAPDNLESIKKMSKSDRVKHMAKTETKWNIYTAVRAFAPNQRVSAENPASGLRGLVVDYDSKASKEAVCELLRESPPQYLPNFMEQTIGDKWRLVWIFEKELLVMDNNFCKLLLETFFKKMGLATLLAGFDPASSKPTQVWTNGGVWFDCKSSPLSKEFCFGVVCEVSNKTSLFGKGEIPLETIAAEVAARFPNRWQGDFKLDAQGVRFWDKKADNETGCQIKPDGMLCFTGNLPFVNWSDIFGRPWVDEQRIMNLGRAGEGIYFDGKNYWQFNNHKWSTMIRQDTLLRLVTKGVSPTKAKGATASDAERVLDYIQRTNRVDGAAPLINYPPGFIMHEGTTPMLNIADLHCTQPMPGPAGDPEKDFPWLWKFFKGLFPRPELMPREHFFAWLQRAYNGILNHKRLMGQAVFLCGPKNNGKTLLLTRIVRPMLGNKMANPMEFMQGGTFNDDLFESALLGINDEDAPSNEFLRSKMLSKLKGLVVNPKHTYHAKFAKKVPIDWTGRLMVTLNDDPGSVGMLMEISTNTRDKQMTFATQPFDGDFPPQEELELIIARELPFFCHWLLNWTPPSNVMRNDRMGVKSYFDPHILTLANHEVFSSNLLELITFWQDIDALWADPKYVAWEGTPTELFDALHSNSRLTELAKEWKVTKLAKNLIALSRQENSPVIHVSDMTRQFKIVRATALAAPEPVKEAA